MRPYKIETPYTILEWNRETFGERPVSVIGARALLEVSEFVHAVILNDPDNIIEEIADVAITLWLVAALSGIDARPSIEESISDSSLIGNSTSMGIECMRFLNKYSRRGKNDASTYLSRSLLLLEIIAKSLNVDLPQAVDNKMAINRNRKWQKLPNGIDQHVA